MKVPFPYPKQAIRHSAPNGGNINPMPPITMMHYHNPRLDAGNGGCLHKAGNFIAIVLYPLFRQLIFLFACPGYFFSGNFLAYKLRKRLQAMIAITAPDFVPVCAHAQIIIKEKLRKARVPAKFHQFPVIRYHLFFYTGTEIFLVSIWQYTVSPGRRQFQIQAFILWIQGVSRMPHRQGKRVHPKSLFF
ncbi:MAG: hypothetical protein IJE17_01235 [Clostridia bacterium]|nr:hypothetical protein [Clostridia bacterium]